jgi:hypothetical protein
MNGFDPVIEIGALCFGVAVGFVTYRTLVRVGDKAAITDLAAVIAAVGGGVVVQLFQPESRLFGWYAIGLLGGMAVFFVLYGILNGWRELGSVMSAKTLVHGGAANPAASGAGRSRGPNAPVD